MHTKSKYLLKIRTSDNFYSVYLSSFMSVVEFLDVTLDKGVKIQIIQRY